MSLVAGSSRLRSAIALTILLFSGLIVSPAVQAQSQEPVRVPAVDAPVPIVPGNRILVQLDEKLISGRGKAGAAIRFRVGNNLYLPESKTVVPEGAVAGGTLIESSGPKNYGRPGKIRLTCDAIALSNGQQIPVRIVKIPKLTGADNRLLLNFIRLPFYTFAAIGAIAESQSDGGWLDGIGYVFAGLAVATGELIHGIIGYFVRGERVTLESGTLFLVEVVGSNTEMLPTTNKN